MFMAAQKDQAANSPQPDAAGQDLALRVAELERYLADQQERFDGLRDLVEAQGAALRSLEQEQRKASNKIRSFLMRDVLWMARMTLRAGPRRALLSYRDYRFLGKSGEFDAGFYARQIKNSSFSNAKLLRHYLTHGYRQGLDPSPDFSVGRYLAIYPDVAKAGIDPFVHYLRHGRREHRLAPASTRVPAAGRPGNGAPVAARRKARQPTDPLYRYMLSPAEVPQTGGFTFTRLMAYLWSIRLDLKTVFDLKSERSRLDFATWFVTDARREYNLPADVFPDDLLEKLRKTGGYAGDIAAKIQSEQEVPRPALPQEGNRTGANLIGYAFGEFGMGEHVRMVARSLSTTDTPFAILDQNVGLHGANDRSVSHWVTDTADYDTNIFHVNADVFPTVYFNYGPEFFQDRHSVGYWAWELAECPPEFDLALNMVDEIWAISEFVADSFRTRARVPVITMPLAVTVPALSPETYTKSYYGLPERFTYLFVFDAASYMDRKNPAAVVRAFRQAFPYGTEPAQLLLKTMNIASGGKLWDDLLREIGDDPRIIVMSDRLSRDALFGLYLASDVFVSLHRSEGFGRGLAEAMAYRRPVVCTNYSGTRDFAHEGTACVVDYSLVPVPEGAYPFADGQVWADPDVGQAAQHMRRLFDDPVFRESVASAGQAFVLENLNERVIGKLYAQRLKEINRRRSKKRSDARHDEIIGGIDAPSPAEALAVSDVLVIQGWAASKLGVESLELEIDGKFMGALHHGILRHDILSAHPQMADSGRAGFFHQIDITSLSQGRHSATVTAVSRSGLQTSWTFDFTTVPSTRYAGWVSKRAALVTRGTMPKLAPKRRVTVVVTHGEGLALTLDSLGAQTYKDVQIIVAGGDMAPSGLLHIEAGPLMWARALAVAEGNFVTTIDAGDVLTPWALERLVDAHLSLGAGMVYGDEDQLVRGARSTPRFKPAWSPNLLSHANYVGRPWSAETALLSEAVPVAGNEHQLLQRLGEKATKVGHVPDILYSRARSVDLAAPAGVKTLQHGPKVSVIIPTCLRNMKLVELCLDGLFKKTDYRDIDVIVVTNNLAKDIDAGQLLARWPVRVVHYDGSFNWSALNNFGTAYAQGDLLLYLNDDVEPLDANWLGCMVTSVTEHGAAVVGPLLRYPNRTIQHLGVNLVDYGGGARHLFRFSRGDEERLQWLVRHPREVSAVTGACLLTTRQCFDALGGFDESLPVVCNDVDFCLRVREKGYTVLVEPRTELIHHEGVSRGGIREEDDVKGFWRRWEHVLRRPDPYTNPNLDPMRDDWIVNPDISRVAAARTASFHQE